MILIDALYVNKGGGAVLLQYLIEKILGNSRKDDFFFVLDPRFKIPMALDKNYVVIPNKMSERKKFYKQNRDKFTKVFCFANIPPPLQLNVPVYTYLHNPKLMDAAERKFTKMYFFLYLKYLVIKLFNKHTDYYMVQTAQMWNKLVSLRLKDAAHCLILPFYDNARYRGNHTPFAERAKDEFVFISTPSPHKNYPGLLDAWAYLLEKGHTPLLHVTIDDTAPGFITRVDELNARGARIVNHGYIDPRELYFSCPYLIFPSVTESFGLPLIEAVDSGMKVLASDLPYVYDVIKPSLTFDTYNKVSIAEAVIKAMNTDLPFPTVVTVDEADKLVALLLEPQINQD